MRKQIIKITTVSIGLLFGQQTWAGAGWDAVMKMEIKIPHKEMAETLANAKNEPPPRFATEYRAKHKKYKENPEEPFNWWEERIYRDLTRNYKKLFIRDIEPNINTVINATDLTTNEKVGALFDIQSKYSEKAAIAVWNNLISKRPDSKNARSAFCKVAAETASIKGRKADEKRGEICDKDFQLDPIKSFSWKDNRTPEVIKSIIIAPKLK